MQYILRKTLQEKNYESWFRVVDKNGILEVRGMIYAKLREELEQNTELKTYLIVFREQKSVQYDWNVVYSGII